MKKLRCKIYLIFLVLEKIYLKKCMWNNKKLHKLYQIYVKYL
jgi:hypothetical protein